MPAAAEIQALLEAIAQNTALYDEDQFAERTDTLDVMELHIFDRLLALATARPQDPQLSALHARASTLRDTLTSLNEQHCQRLRARITAGDYDRCTLMRELSRYSIPTGVEKGGVGEAPTEKPTHSGVGKGGVGEAPTEKPTHSGVGKGGVGEAPTEKPTHVPNDVGMQYTQAHVPSINDELTYDSLDVLMNGMLQIDSGPEEPEALEAEMIAYQPTPSRLIFEMIQLTQLNQADVFYDIGSGLGHVPIVVSLITGARAIGIEFQPAYCAYARRCAAALNLPNISFRQQDAREADFSDGTLFYLYSPFHGTILQAVLDRLRGVAEQRDIRICAYGPCAAAVARQGWLALEGPVSLGRSPIALFHSHTR